MEEILDIEPGSTLMPALPPRDTELTTTEEYDKKDGEIDAQFQEVYEAAMDAYEVQATDAELVEPKYRARTQEVAVQYLNTALAAAKEKSGTKQHKDKLNASKVKGGPRTVNQNLIVADRNDILRQILGQTE